MYRIIIILIVFNKDTLDGYKNRVILPKVNGEWQSSDCIITESDLHQCLNDKNTLYFRISVMINSKTKPWLATYHNYGNMYPLYNKVYNYFSYI